MASLHCLLVIFFLVKASSGDTGYVVDFRDLVDKVNVTGTVSALTISDGNAWINSGDIFAVTVNIAESTSAGDATFLTVEAGDATVGDLMTTDFSVTNLTTSNLNAELAFFWSDVTVQQAITFNNTWLSGYLNVATLTSTGDAITESSLFAHGTLQITGGLAVVSEMEPSDTQVWGDFLTNSSLMVEDMLTVNGLLSTMELISVSLETIDLNVPNLANIQSASVQSSTMAELMVDEDLLIHQNTIINGSSMSHNLVLMNSLLVGQNSTISGILSVTKISNISGNIYITQNTSVNGSFWSNQTTVEGNVTGHRNMSVEGVVDSAGTITGDEGDFSETMVNTGEITTLTTNFVTAGTLQGSDVTVQQTFEVTGSTTLDLLNVKDTTTLNTLNATRLGCTSINTNTTITSTLNATIGNLTIVDVKTSLVAGKPTQSSNWYASFHNIYSDNINISISTGNYAFVDSISGSTLHYNNIQGIMGTLENDTTTHAAFTWATLENTDILSLQSPVATISQLEAISTTSLYLSATKGEITTETGSHVWTVNISSSTASSTVTNSSDSQAGTLIATSGTLTTLIGSNATLEKLKSNTATLTQLNSTTGSLTSLIGTFLNYTNGTITNLSANNARSRLLGSSQLSSTPWLFANTTSFSLCDSMIFDISSMGNFYNAFILGNLSVFNDTSLDSGFISGEAVVASLTVVSDTVFDSLSVTGPAFFTEIDVKRVTVTDTFTSMVSSLGDTTVGNLSVTSGLSVKGNFSITGDSNLGGNLDVNGTTQFEIGSFSIVGASVITTTDMEAFNIDVQDGTFSSITVSNLDVSRSITFEQVLELAPMLGDTSGATSSFYTSIAPTSLTATGDGFTFPVFAGTVLHTSSPTIDALVVTEPTNSSQAGVRFMGDGGVDLLDGSMGLDDLEISGGIVFDNENNAAFISDGQSPSISLTSGTDNSWFSYSDLMDRDLGLPGQGWNVTRFHRPVDKFDLLTLEQGHYKVSGSVDFILDSPASANSILVATAGIYSYNGTNTTGSPLWWTECVANFNIIQGYIWGGSCSFADLLMVQEGQVMTLNTNAAFKFSSVPITNSLTLDPSSTVLIEEYFVRTSEDLSVF